MKTKSRFFNSIKDVARKGEVLAEHYRNKRITNEKCIRLHNGLSQYQEGVNDKSKDDSDEITNFLVSWKGFNKHMSMYSGMLDQTKRFAEVKFETGDPVEDQRVSAIVSKILNKNIFHYDSEFSNFMSRFGGEELATGVTILMKEGKEIFPEIERNLLFPPQTKMSGKDLTYWFRPVNLTIRQLVEYQGSDLDEGDSYMNTTAIKRLLDAINDRIGKANAEDMGSELVFGSGDYLDEGWGHLRSDTTVAASWYYEVQKDGSVNKTLYTRGVEHQVDDATEVMFVKETADRVNDIIRFHPVSTLIGGGDTIDDAVGLMILTYNLTAETNEVFNQMMDAALFDLKPKWNKGEDMDDLSSVDFNNDSVFDSRLSLMQERQNSNSAGNMAQALIQQSADITNSQNSNVGSHNELSSKVKLLGKEQAGLDKNLLSKRYRNLDKEVEAIVFDILANKPDKDSDDMTSDYEARKSVHDCLEEEEIDISKYIERSGGRLKNMTVTCDRVLSPGDSNGLDVQRSYLAETLQQRAPEARKIAMFKMDSSILNPDLAETLNGMDGHLNKIMSDQKFVARAENEQVKSYAIAGIEFPTGIGDVDEIHAEEHLVAIQVMLSMAQIQPWSRLQVIQVGGLINHVNFHLQNIIESGDRETYNQILESLSELVNQSRELAAQVEQQEQSQNAEMTPEQIKIAELELKAKKVMIDQEKNQIAAMNQERLSRSNDLNDQLKTRKQYSSEIFQSAQVKNQAAAMQKNNG